MVLEGALINGNTCNMCGTCRSQPIFMHRVLKINHSESAFVSIFDARIDPKMNDFAIFKPIPSHIELEMYD